ncbi:MAG TPA: hypothetical protein VGG72_09275 [Bryobacteraceae bacterium]|jgi:hypothetical protein
MKMIPILLICPMLTCVSSALAGDLKALPNQAGNNDIDLQGTVLIVRNDIKLALDGPDLPPEYIAVRMKVTPKSGAPLRISPDDFTLLSRKNGERSPALSPNQIAGGGTVLMVKPAANQPGGDGTTANGPIWGGVSLGRRSSTNSNTAPSVHTENRDGDAPMVKLLAAKALPDKDIKDAVEGLLYFAMDGKLKPKDLSMIYQGPAGKLVIDFK